MARGGWSRAPSGFAEIVEADLTQHVKRVAAEGLQMVISGSPVDTGSYRANHRVSVGSPDNGVDTDAAQASPGRGSFTGVASYEDGMQKIAALNVPFTTVFIQNNIAHGTAIENGSSDQAGEGVYSVAANSLREKYGR